MAYEATSEALRGAWGVFWPTRVAVLLVAVFAALSLGPADRRLGLPRFLAVLFTAQFARWHWIS